MIGVPSSTLYGIHIGGSGGGGSLGTTPQTTPGALTPWGQTFVQRFYNQSQIAAMCGPDPVACDPDEEVEKPHDPNACPACKRGYRNSDVTHEYCVGCGHKREVVELTPAPVVTKEDVDKMLEAHRRINQVYKTTTGIQKAARDWQQEMSDFLDKSREAQKQVEHMRKLQEEFNQRYGPPKKDHWGGLSRFVLHAGQRWL